MVLSHIVYLIYSYIYIYIYIYISKKVNVIRQYIKKRIDNKVIQVEAEIYKIQKLRENDKTIP